jgi:hypothetical protein
MRCVFIALTLHRDARSTTPSASPLNSTKVIGKKNHHKLFSVLYNSALFFLRTIHSSCTLRKADLNERLSVMPPLA